VLVQSAIFVQRLITWDNEAFQKPTTAQTQTLAAIHFMTRLTFILIFFAALTARGQQRHDGLIGAYQAKGGFEKYSILVLKADKSFTYEYGLGGCQGEVEGTWIVKKNKLILTNDNEFLGKEIAVHPDMSLTSWTIKKKALKPDGMVDCGCVKETRKHFRMK